MNFKGVIIEESLTDFSIINELEIIDTYISETTSKEETPWLDKWTLQTVIIKENNIDDISNKLSKLIDTNHCNNWYCDFRNKEYHYVIFSNKVFVLNRKKKKDYEDMRLYALSIGLPEHQLPTFNDLPTNLLIGFLIDAKKETYANENIEKVNSSRLGSHDYHYETEIEGEIMIYHDTYFGGFKFIGEEVVYRETDTPKWGMNYYGVTLDDTFGEEAIDKALRPALMKVGEDDTVLPLRGPSKYINGEYIYTFKTDGNIESFSGIEEVHKDDKLIYRLTCHGGIIE